MADLNTQDQLGARLRGSYGPGHGEARLCNMHNRYLQKGVCVECEQPWELLREARAMMGERMGHKRQPLVDRIDIALDVHYD